MTLRRLAISTLLGAGLVVFAASSASAHTSLIDVQPADGATVSEGTAVTLTFSDNLLELGTEITVTDASGESVPLDVTRPDPASVQVTLPALVDGPVAVAWRVVAGDGHPIEGTLGYTAVGSASPPSASPAGSDAPTASAASSVQRPTPETTSATASASPGAADQGVTGDTSNQGLSLAGWLAIGAVILAAALVGVFAKKRR